jgi:hypothetical protein
MPRRPCVHVTTEDEGVLWPVWTVKSGAKTFRVKTSSMNAALAHAQLRTKQAAAPVQLTFEPETPRTPRPGRTTRHGRRRSVLKPEALRRREAGATVTAIAKALRVPRETVRDWLRAEGA